MTQENNILAKCTGCKLTGMDAINCQTFLELESEEESQVQCYSVQYSQVKVAGGRYVSGPRVFNRGKHGLSTLPNVPPRTHWGRKNNE